MRDFIPPIDNPVFLRLAKSILLPMILHHENLEVKVSPACNMALRRLHGKHGLLLMNHSDRDDPIIAFALSKLSDEDFYYLAARELFDYDAGMRGWVLQNCGTYSVIRGTPIDMQSREMTITLLAKGNRKLVMFPEGDVSGRDDKVLPLKEDGVHNMFEAQERLLRKGSVEPIYLLPVGIYYEVLPDAIEPMRDALSRLERVFRLPAEEFTFAARIEAVINAMVAHLEDFYGISPTDAGLEERLLNLCRDVAATIGSWRCWAAKTCRAQESSSGW